MSQSGKSPANVIDSPPQGEEDRSLNPDSTGHEHAHEHEGHPHEHGHEHEHEHEGHEAGDGKKSGPRLPFAHLTPSAKAKWKRETRFGIAALLSFVILVTVLILNKGRANGAKAGGKPAKAPVLVAINANKEPEPSEPPSEPPSSSSSPAPAPSKAPAEASPAPPESPPAPAESSPAPAGDPPAPTPNADTLLPPLPQKAPESPEPGANAGPKTDPDKATEPGALTTGTESKSDPMPPGDPAPNAAPPIPDPNSGPPGPPLTETPKDPPPTTPANEPPGGVPLPGPQEAPAPPLASDAAPPLPPREAETPGPSAPGDSPGSLLPPGGAAPEPPAPPPTPTPARAPAAPGPAPEPPAKPAAQEVSPAQAAAAPAPPEQLERVPSLSTPPPTNEAPLAEYPAPDFKPGTGIPIPNAGKGRTFEDELATAAAPGVVDAAAGLATSSRRAEEDVVEPVPHVVRRGENFFTISKQHYGYGRYWKALWKANSDIVPAADKLWVGTTIRIPPPEELDRSLIEAPRFTQSAASSGTVRRASQSAPPGNARRGSQVLPSSERELALPSADPFIPRARRSRLDDPSEPIPEVRSRPSRPRYPVRKGETLRSIAQDTLGDAHRAKDILELNRDILDDPRDLVEGQYLELPEDAHVGRRGR